MSDLLGLSKALLIEMYCYQETRAEQLTKELEEAHRAIADHLTKRGEYKAEVDRLRGHIVTYHNTRMLKLGAERTAAVQEAYSRMIDLALQSTDSKQENE